MSDIQGKYVKLESFTDRALASLIGLRAPLTTAVVVLALGAAFALGLML